MSVRNTTGAVRKARQARDIRQCHRARRRNCRILIASALALLASGLIDPAFAQRERGDSGRSDNDAAPGSARSAAPIDLTGYWVSVISEDWAWRMRTPPKGDYASLPLNDEAIRVADQWTTDQDGSCLAHGAAASLRMPTRVHIEWQNDDTLRIDIDNGMQTRLLHFDSGQPATNATLQGYSVAHWVTTDTVTGSGATGGILTSDLDRQPWASLEVVTTNMRAAWLRPNGVPYSNNTVLTEYFDHFSDGNDEWFTVTIIVNDPAYLTEPVVISSNFRREPDDSKWSPRACRS